MRALLAKGLMLLIIYLSACFTVPISNSAYASHLLFQDNFNDNDISDWMVVRNMQWNNPLQPCLLQGVPTNWTTDNNRAGIKINGPGCITELIPNNFKLPDQSGYVYELDMTFAGSSVADRNINFRYVNPTNWYGFHIYGNDIHFEKVVGNYYRLESNSYLFQDNQDYHFKVEFANNTIKLFINSVEFWSITDSPPYINNTTIALQAGVGADPDTEVWFDNILVTGIDDIIPVPYFSQNTLPWGSTEYDHAAFLGFSNGTLDRWGCAVTSAAMVLRYHGMNEFADGTPIDPGSLNTWLKNNNGYLTGNGSGGSYSYLLWPSISKLTKDLFDASKSATKLEHKRAYPSAQTTSLLNDDLLLRKIPDILQVQNASTSGHFIVAKGLTNNIYDINDPEWNVPTLTSFNNTYSQVDRFVPSNTNLSYLVVVTNPIIDFLVTDPNGKKTGKDPSTGQLFNEISDATYALENPISNPNTQGISEQLGSPVHTFLLPQPLSGNYHISAGGNATETYTLNVATFQEDGSSQITQSTGSVGPGSQETFDIQYSQTQTSSINKIITFQSTLDDIDEAQTLDLISKDSIAKRLTNMLSHAQQQSQRGNVKQALHNLSQFEDLLNKERGKNISEEAYQILLEDVTYLMNHL